MPGKQVVVEGGGVVGGGVEQLVGGGDDKGGASAVYKMLIAPTRAKPLENPHFEKDGPTKLPSQMGHKGSEAVYRTFRRPPACPPAPIVCLGKGRWVGAEE